MTFLICFYVKPWSLSKHFRYTIYVLLLNIQ